MALKDPDSLLEMEFSMEQIEKIGQGTTLKTLGFEIHHDYRVGRMLIVEGHVHRLPHRGGRSLW